MQIHILIISDGKFPKSYYSPQYCCPEAVDDMFLHTSPVWYFRKTIQYPARSKVKDDL